MGRKDGRLAKWGPAVFFAAAFIALWVFLERTQLYVFHYREQQQVFLLDWRYVLGLLKRPGGFSLALSQALVQFFPLPLVGSAVTALLGILAGAALWGVCRRIQEIPWLLPLCLVPSLLILTALTDTFLSYQALVAFGLAVGLVWTYAAGISSRRIGTRLWAGAILTLLAFVLSGPFAMTVVAPGIFLSDLFARREKALWQGVQPLLAFGTGLAGIAGGVWKDLTDAFCCDGFYEAWLEVPFSVNLCWIALLSCLVVFFLCSFIRRMPLPAGIGLALLLTVLTVFFYREGVRKTLDPRDYASKRMYCLISAGDWDTVLRDPAARYNNLLLTNMVNLALSQKGSLLEDMFAYPQNGPSSLLVADEETLQDASLLQIISQIHYHFGNVACAQNLGFDAFVGQRYGNPTMLRLLVKTNLVTGAYGVAEKYIARLEKTWRYADWATGMRPFLWNDAAVESDPELGAKRKDLPLENAFLFTHGVYKEMQDILEANPSDRVARDYQLALLLLFKNISGIRAFVDTHFGTPVLPELPSLVQQALIVASEDNLDWCRSHGVSQEMTGRFEKFRERYASAVRAGENPANLLRREFGSTYWYYYLFKESKT